MNEIRRVTRGSGARRIRTGEVIPGSTAAPTNPIGTKMLGVRVPEVMHRQLKLLAVQDGLPLGGVCVELIRRYIEDPEFRAETNSLVLR